jgi:hypothetical protein
MKISRLIIRKTINIPDKICRENQKTHLLFSNFCRKSHCFVVLQKPVCSSYFQIGSDHFSRLIYNSSQKLRCLITIVYFCFIVISWITIALLKLLCGKHQSISSFTFSFFHTWYLVKHREITNSMEQSFLSEVNSGSGVYERFVTFCNSVVFFFYGRFVGL